MSRSRRKAPFVGMTTAKSEKQDKRLYHKSHRQAERQALHHDKDVMPHKNEVTNVYGWAKDGRQRIDPKSKWMRK